jgi:SAM-dependent methyltransferase
VRRIITPEGRGELWTLICHGRDVHQTTSYTAEDRYPELFQMAAMQKPGAKRILSFGCSTGEELVALRIRFPRARIVGVEINLRSRRIARLRSAGDPHTLVMAPTSLTGEFDVIFALAVFQREPVKTEEAGISDLSKTYPFGRFDTAVKSLVARLRPGGLLCVTNSQYRVEDSSVARQLQSVSNAAIARGQFFDRDGKCLRGASACTMFWKVPS